MNQVTVIGVAGGSGSGKSTLVKKLREAFDEVDVVTLCHDFYYKANDGLTFEERSRLNFDHPGAFDTDMMVEHVKMLKAGLKIEHPIYSFSEHARLDERVTLAPARVVIIDGILVFENEELRNTMDIKVYVDTDADVRFARRLLRDVKDRGRTMESVVQQYLTTVKPMHEEFVEPSKRHADIIVPEGGFNSVALQMLIESINAMIMENK